MDLSIRCVRKAYLTLQQYMYLRSIFFKKTPRICPVTESAPLSPTCKLHKRLPFQDCIPNECNKCQKSESKKTKNCVVSTSLVRHSSFRMQASRIAQMNSSSDDSGRWQVSLARGSTAHARGLLTRWCVRSGPAGCASSACFWSANYFLRCWTWVAPTNSFWCFGTDYITG